MQRFYFLARAYGLAFILIVFTAIIIFSCKKGQNKTDDFNTIENAKEWFSKTEKNYLPAWDKSSVIESNNVNYIIVASNYSLKSDRNKIISTLVIADSLGNYSAKLLEFINSDSPEELIDIITIYKSGLKLKNLKNDYTGNLLVLNSDHRYLYGLQLKDGYLKHNLTI